MLRNLVIFSVVGLAASASWAQTCDPNTFTEVCNVDGTIQVCDNQTDPNAPVEAAISCSDVFGPGAADAACVAAPGCTGACDGVGLGCEAPLGSSCVGFSPLVDGDTANDDTAGSVLCAGDATCQLGVETGAPVDTCVAHVGPACAAGGESSACTGSVWTICLTDQNNTLALTSNIALDCAIFQDSTCGEQPCECNANCGTNGVCTNGFCEGGVTCTGPVDSTQCAGNEGEGEGEGEGDAECTQDSECGRDRECKNGSCVAIEEEEETPPGCANANAAMAPLAGMLVVLAPLLRRRRR